MPNVTPRYWAFVSYSHADLRWARWLHRALEGYQVPARLVGRPTRAGAAPRRLRPIFRDLDEMGAGPDLGDRLKAALAQSANLIVVCSPAAAASPWVNEEIRAFKAAHGEDAVFAVIVAGEPFASERWGGASLECFPEALRRRAADGLRVEPIAADLRPGKQGRQAALLKLVAGLLGLELDEIVRRDAHRRQQQLAVFASLCGGVAVAMGALAMVAIQERDAARAERAQAEGLIEFMIGDLREKLQPAGRLDILDAIGAKAQAYYTADSSRRLDARSLGRHARVLHLLGDIRQQRGDLPAALSMFEEASERTGELVKRRPKDPQAIFDHAQSVAYVGEVAYQRGETAVALSQFQTYQSLARRLAALDPKNPDWQAEVAEADTNLGAVVLSQARPDAAARQFQDALAISRRLAAGAPESRARQWDESQILAWLADAEVARGRLDAALSDRTQEGQIYDALIATSPRDTEAAVARAASRAAIAKIELATGAVPAAIAALEPAAQDLDRLAREAPDNADYKANAAPVLRLLAQALLQQGRLGDAAAAAARAIDLCEAQVSAAEQRHDEALSWRGARLGAARIVALKIAAARASTLAAQRLALGAAPDEWARLRALSDRHRQDRALALTAAEAGLLAGDVESASGRKERARTYWAWAQTTASRLASSAPLTDRTGILLREIGFRLSFSRPPAGPLASNAAAGLSRKVSPALRTPADYRW